MTKAARRPPRRPSPARRQPARRPPEKPPRRRWGCLTRLLVTVVVLAAAVGWFWWQQNGLSSETIAVPSAPDGFAGYRIAVISDLHGKEFGQDNEKLIDYVRDLEPDLIAVTGDLIHDPAQMAMVEPVAKGLASIAPAYYVTGNHEWAAKVVPELEELLEECGIHVLSNEYVMLTEGGDQIALVGAEDSNGYADQITVGELADRVRREQGDVYTILLSHRNNHYEQYQEARVDLTLSGHAHGGLIRLPGTDGLIGPKRELWPQYTAGLYDLSYGQMVVSRGLGNQFPCFRLFNRPDVPLVVLE
ncbi:MAG TPA: metallophosphoesterase [Candidatus Evtepia faecigallinarum]|nr:metallophosphoesterase [Candidatus Evtepia faecigallinarum]